VTNDTLLENLLEPGRLSAVFQPILQIATPGMKVHAFECLTRGPAGTNLESPNVLFEYARRKHAEGPVDRACVATVLNAARALPVGARLSINVHASTLSRDHEFIVFLGDTAEVCGIALDRVIIEVVEHVFPWDRSSFLNCLEGLRAVGVAIALDDIGLGQSNYHMILDTRPDYFKIDGYFVKGCRTDFYRQAVLESIAGLARRFGARVVAEAVENEGDLSIVAGLGIDLVQGWLFGKPAAGTESLAALGPGVSLATDEKPGEHHVLTPPTSSKK
jgi:EAL domain-containing protein (putative c-di-GMP-specific phosphodiesterase class I)